MSKADMQFPKLTMFFYLTAEKAQFLCRSFFSYRLPHFDNVKP